MSERFSGQSFERRPEVSGTSPDRLLLAEARNAALEMLHGPDDALTHEIAEKILAKAEIKDRVGELATYADDVTVYQELKRLGVFVVRDAISAIDYEDETTGFSIRKGDRYLDLHVPPVPKELRSRQAVETSLDLITQYIKTHQLNPKYIMGITYERMATLAERQFGFTVAYPDTDSLPDGVVMGVRRVHEGFTQAGMDGKDIGLPALVFIETAPTSETQNHEIPQVHRNLGGFALRGHSQ